MTSGCDRNAPAATNGLIPGGRNRGTMRVVFGEAAPMSEKSESAARVITVALKELVRIAEEGDLPMLSYLLGLALAEATAQEGGSDAVASSNVFPFSKN